MRTFYGWNEEPFTVPADVRAYFAELQTGYTKQREAYDAMFAAYKKAYPDLAKEWVALARKETAGRAEGQDSRLWNASGAKATRAASGDVLNIFAEYLPNLFGGSADLAPSNKTELKGKGFFSAENRLAHERAFRHP